MESPISRFSGEFTPARIRSADRGCDRSFEQMLVQSQPQIRAYVLSLVLNWADADEILQETCVRLYEQRDEWDRHRSFGAWARTIAYYQVLSHRKKIQRERLYFSGRLVEAVADRHDRDLESNFEARRRALKVCRDRLSAASRRLLDLAYRGDANIREVAEVLGRSVAATYKALSRIRKTLYDCVERTLQVEGHE